MSTRPSDIEASPRARIVATARWLDERRGIPVELVGGLSRKPEHFLRDSAHGPHVRYWHFCDVARDENEVCFKLGIGRL